MLLILQLFLAVFAIGSAIYISGDLRLYVPLVSLVFMFIVGRMDRSRSEKTNARKTYLRSEMDKLHEKDSSAEKEGDFFTIESLLWPKNEILFIEVIHSVFKEFGFKVSTGIKNPLVDRVIIIPHSQKTFGVQILMCEGEAEINHPKVRKALQFQKEKNGEERTLIIAGTHIHLPLSEREKVNHLSRGLMDFLLQHHITLMTSHHLYHLWQRGKKGEVNIHEVFDKIHSQSGGLVQLKDL